VELSLVNKVIIGEYYVGKCDVHFVFNIVDPSCFPYEGSYRSLSPKSHGVPTQENAGFTHSPLDTARFNINKLQSITGLHQQISDILDDKLHLDSHKPHCSPNSVTLLADRYWLLTSPPVCRISLIYAQTISRNSLA
jgi:hypothetical protein